MSSTQSRPVGTFDPESVAVKIGDRVLTVQDMQDLQDAYDNGQMYRRLMSNSVRRVIKILGLKDDQTVVSDMARDIVLNGVEPQEVIRKIKKYRGESLA